MVLRLRGHLDVGTTLIDVLTHYARELRRAHGRLYLAGISGDTAAWLRRNRNLRRARVRLHAATPVLGESMREAAASASRWLEKRKRRDDDTDG